MTRPRPARARRTVRPRPARAARPARPRLTAAVAGALTAVAALAGIALVPAPAEAGGLRWEVSWQAPVSDRTPSPVGRDAVLAGRLSPPTGQVNPSASLAVRSSLPAACTARPGPVTVARETFRVDPGLACNGTYEVTLSSQAQVLGLPLPSRGPALGATLEVADPGPAPAAPSATVDSANRRVTLHVSVPDDPDVVGARLTRDGRVVAELPAGTGRHVDAVGGPGDYDYRVQVRRWGAGGPGSAEVLSPASAPLTAQVRDGAPVVGIGGSGGGSGSGGGDTGGSGAGPGTGGSGTGAGGSSGGSGAAALPGSATASPRLPGGSRTRIGASTGSIRTHHRSGTASGSSSSATPTTGPEVFEERLPYEPTTKRETYRTATPGRTRTVAVDEVVRTRDRPGLLAPAALVVLLVAAAIQVRALVRRSQQAAEAMAPLDP